MCFELTLWEQVYMWIQVWGFHPIPIPVPANIHPWSWRECTVNLFLWKEGISRIDFSIAFLLFLLFLLETVILLYGPSWPQTQSFCLSLPSAGIAGTYHQDPICQLFSKKAHCAQEWLRASWQGSSYLWPHFNVSHWAIRMGTVWAFTDECASSSFTRHSK